MVSSYHQYNTCLITFISLHTSQHKIGATQNVTELKLISFIHLPFRFCAPNNFVFYVVVY